MAEEKQSCAFRTSIGGQALIEGIMMRGPEKQAIVVRDLKQSSCTELHIFCMKAAFRSFRGL